MMKLTVAAHSLHDPDISLMLQHMAEVELLAHGSAHVTDFRDLAEVLL